MQTRDHFTALLEAGNIGEVKHPASLLLALLFTSWTAEARIGETAEESKKRYGEEQTLLGVRQQIDEIEVALAGLKKAFDDPQVLSYCSNEEAKALKELAQKSAQNERFIKIKDFYKDLQGKGSLERNALISNNRDVNDFFGKKIVSYEALGREIKDHDLKLKNLSERIQPTPLYEGPDEFLRLASRGGELRRKQIIQYIELVDTMEKCEQRIKTLKQKEHDLADIEKHSNKEELKFFKDGYWIMCSLRNDKTYQIFYYRKEISSEDVMQVLVNNSDEGVTWESVVVKDQVVDDKEFLPLVVYSSSDGKLEGIFGKWVKDKADLGDMRGVLIRERSSVIEPAIKKEERGL